MSVYSFDTPNVNTAFTEMLWKIRALGRKEDSRNGPVLVMPHPVATTYLYPQERVLFNAKRDANPVFHLVESLWMFAGRDDVASLLPYNSKYGQYAESDGTVHGAYGRRWVNEFGADQILEIIRILKKDRNSRQAVMQMWNCKKDLGTVVKDKPCNTHIYFEIRDGHLNMTVLCRSNDMLWGAYGANAVHMSMLQEIIAWGVDAPIGTYTQFSNNFHLYTDVPMVREFLDSPPSESDDRYSAGTVDVTPMFQKGETVEDFLEDCERWFSGRTFYLENKFLENIAWPLALAYADRKHTDKWDQRPGMQAMSDRCDWRVAFNEWAARRAK